MRASTPRRCGTTSPGFADLANLPSYKVKSALIGLRTYSQWLDLLSILALLLPVALALVARRLAVHGGLLLAFGGLLLGFLVCPMSWGVGPGCRARRFASWPRWLPVRVCPDLPRSGRAAMAGAAAAGLAETGVVGDLVPAPGGCGAVYRALESVPPGAAILPVAHRPVDHGVAPSAAYAAMDSPSFRHLPNLALPWRQDFVPTLFTAPRAQPIRVLPPWDRVAVTASVLVSICQCAHPARPYRRGRALCRLCRAGLGRVYDYVLVE